MQIPEGGEFSAAGASSSQLAEGREGGKPGAPRGGPGEEGGGARASAATAGGMREETCGFLDETTSSTICISTCGEARKSARGRARVW